MRTALIAVLAAAAAGCTNNEMPDAGNNTPHTQSGKTTIHVGTGQDAANTRVAYDDNQLTAQGNALTWEAGDRLTVVRMNAGSYVEHKDDYQYRGTPGATSGSFEGTEIIAGGDSWAAYYPHTVTIDANDGTPTLSMTGQIQAADNSTAHLKSHMLLAATDLPSLAGGFDLEMKSSILKFELKDVPPAVGKLKKLTWAVETDDGIQSLTLSFAQGAVDFGIGGGTLTAYLAFMPQDMVVKAGGKFTVILTGDQTHLAETTIAQGKTYEAGKRYTAEVDGNTISWQETEIMKLTVKVEDGNLDFNIPFPTNGNTTPADITVDWGDDSQVTVVASGTPLSESDSFGHTYSIAGTYTITISSNQTNETQQQIPELNFYSYRDGHANTTKLFSVDTPLLNTGATDLTGCFASCLKLQEVSKGLFDKHTGITNFTACFYDCKALQSIPKGLFDKHTQATIFANSFTNCAALQSIPKGLFDQNTQAEVFGNCFSHCIALQNIPEGLFDQNTAATDFNNCFRDCAALQSIPEGLFDKNMQATNFNFTFCDCTNLVLNEKIFSTENPPYDRFSGKVVNVAGCFRNVGINLASGEAGTAPDLWNYNWEIGSSNSSGCFAGANKLSNWDDIPKGWGGPKE